MLVCAAITSFFIAQMQLEIFGNSLRHSLPYELAIDELDFICLLQLCQNNVQFKMMNLNFATNFVILNKHFELLNRYVLEFNCKVELV